MVIFKIIDDHIQDLLWKGRHQFAEAEQLDQEQRSACTATVSHTFHETAPLILMLSRDGNGSSSARGPKGIDRLVTFDERALQRCPTGHPGRAKALLKLSEVLFTRFQQRGQFSDLERSIALGDESLQLLPKGDPERIKLLVFLNAILDAGFNHSHDSHYLDRSIELMEESLEHNTAGHRDRLGSLTKLSTGLESRYKSRGDAADLDRLIILDSEALDLHPRGNPHRASALVNLSLSLRTRFHQRGDSSDISRALALAEEALQVPLPPTGAQTRANLLANLSETLRAQYQRQGDVVDLDRYIALDREILDSRQLEHPARADLLVSLSTRLHDRFTLSGDIADLHSAIALLEEALQLCPLGNPDRAHTLTNLSKIIQTRADELGNAQDLNRSIMLAEEAVELTPPGDPERADRLGNLSMSLHTRFKQQGDVEDLDRSVVLGKSALRSCLHGSSDHLIILGNLSISLTSRCNRFGDIADLDHAIALIKQHLELLPPTHPDRADALSNLSALIGQRFSKKGNGDDIERAVELLEESVRLIPSGHPHRSSSLGNLAVALRTRNGTGDLHRSIVIDEEALQLRPPGHPDRAKSLVNLGIAFMSCYRRSRDVSDLKRAIQFGYEAIKLHPRGHPDFLSTAITLATFFSYAQDGVSTTLEIICTALRNVAIIPISDLPEVCRCLRDIHDDTANINPALLSGYRLLILHFPRLVYFGLDTPARLRILEQAGPTVIGGARCALELSCTSEALEILEEGRSLSWSQSLKLRTAFDRLPQHLSSKLRKVASQLEYVSIRGGHPDPSADTATPDETAALGRQLTRQFEDLLTEVRMLPDFQSFLLPQPSSSLMAAAEHGPIVILVAGLLCSFAIVLRPQQAAPEQIKLSNITTNQLSDASGHLRSANEDARDDITDDRALKLTKQKPRPAKQVLENLWEVIVNSIIPALGLHKCERGTRPPRVWWCPTGPFVFLPIHAAGLDSNYCSDYMVQSYTPTVTALLQARKHYRPTLCSDVKLLLGAVPYPGGNASDLPKTIDEVNLIRSIVPNNSILPIPLTEDSTRLVEGSVPSGLCKKTVVDLLSQATIFHVACHGTQDMRNPLQSGLLMQDGHLSLSKLIELNLQKGFLAFLSACQSAKGDKAQPDQAIHLAAAMLFVGFRSVIATMWSMNDYDGPSVARRVYTELFKAGNDYLEANDVAYAVHEATRELRMSGIPHSRWATYIHIGM